ncbi:MAG: hypothetical protein M0R03_03320 [Novosphingobium sp.]|nr:hypothetical protein [Novosphingobium sp.]
MSAFITWAVIDQERFQQLILEAHVLGGDDAAMIYLTDPASCHGVRIELVAAAGKAGTLVWIHRDKAPGQATD